MPRLGWVIGLRPEKVEEYKRLHAAVWPGVLRMIKECHLQNYSIFLRQIEGKPYLFAYAEYTGEDLAADMARMAADPTTRQWWSHCGPCQVPLADRAPGEWWASMEEVFHID